MTSLHSQLPFDGTTNNRIINDINLARSNEIRSEITKLEDQLRHFNKVLHRCQNVNTILTTSGLIILLGTTTVACGLGFGVVVAPVTLSLIAGIGGFGGICNESFKIVLVKNKISYLKKKIKHVEKYINESHYLFEKIRDDKIISLDEIQDFRKLMGEYAKKKPNIYEQKVKISDSQVRKLTIEKLKKDFLERGCPSGNKGL